MQRANHESAANHSVAAPATPHEFVQSHIRLVSLPEVVLQVQALAEDPQCSVKELGELIGTDPALTARLLRLVNSPFYGFRSRVETLSRAVTLVGIAELRNLTLAASAVEVFARLSSDLIDMVGFWRHSVFTGLVARNLAVECRVLHPERLFIAGLLHDVGSLLIYAKLPDAASQVRSRVRTEEGAVCVLEREVLGFTHAEVGAELLAGWSLPAGLREAVACHHEPGCARHARLEASLVHLGNAVSNCLESVGNQMAPQGYDPYAHLLPDHADSLSNALATLLEVDPVAWQICEVSEKSIGIALRKASDDFEGVLDMLYPI